MKLIVFARCFALSAIALSISAFTAAAEPVNASRFGLYVVVDDMDRARAFYEQLFGVPEIQMPNLVGFDVAGGLYAVVLRETYAADAVHGDTMRAYINVRDINASFTRVQAIAPSRLESPEVIVEGPFRFFKIRDPDNNILEFYSIDPTPSDSQ